MSQKDMVEPSLGRKQNRIARHCTVLLLTLLLDICINTFEVPSLSLIVVQNCPEHQSLL